MLKTKQVGEYTVSEMGTLEQVRLRLFQKQVAERMIDKVTKEPINDPELEEALAGWAVVAACTKPMITMDEWITTPLSTLNPIQAAVEELNAAMLGVSDEKIGPAQAKKNKRSSLKK